MDPDQNSCVLSEDSISILVQESLLDSENSSRLPSDLPDCELSVGAVIRIPYDPDDIAELSQALNEDEPVNDEETIENVKFDKIEDDPLDFKDLKKYSDRLKIARNKTNSYDAISIKYGLINNKPCVLLLFDFSFMGGSMGRSVGDAIIKAVDTAIEKNCALLIIPSSGGARMQEGILSLMQMPRSVVAIQKLKDKCLPYIVLLSNPTTGGVTASFAMLGDIHLAEPGAVIGFAGRRVIEETVKEKLPDDFQKSEYLLEHGMIDRVIERKNQKKEITQILDFFQK